MSVLASEVALRCLDAVSDAVWVVGRDWRYEYVNPAAEALVGQTAANLIGRTVWEVSPETVGTDREQSYRAVMAGGTRVELRFFQPSLGIPVLVRVEPDPRGLRIFGQSLDRLRELERQARLEELILASTGEGIFGLAVDGTLTFVNPAALSLLGYPAGALTGVDMHRAVHAWRADGSLFPSQECPIFRTLADGTTRRVVDEVFWRADDSMLPVEYLVVPIVEDGAITGAVVSFADTTERHEAHRAAAHSDRVQRALGELQAALAPALPSFADPALGVHYVPADGAGAGGDLYDWQLLPDGSIHLAVVDVAGKGIAAARDALAVTHALRLLVMSGVPLEQVVTRASNLLALSDPDLVATAVVANYTPGTGRLQVTAAGHPPGLLVTGTGVQWLDSEGIPLGWPGACSGEVVDVVVPPGGRVLLYTDGLIEGRRDLTEGLDRLAARALAAVGLPPAEMARQLVEQTLAEAQRRDDSLVLVIGRP